MVTGTRVREILLAAAHIQGGFLTSGFQVQTRDPHGPTVLFYDAQAIVSARPAEIDRHLLQYAATLEAAGLHAMRHEHYLQVDDLCSLDHARRSRTRHRTERPADVRAVVGAEIERCVTAIIDEIGLEATKPGSLYADLFHQMRYPATPLTVGAFGVPDDMLQFVEQLRESPTVHIAIRRWVRRSCADVLRRVRLRQHLMSPYNEMIAAIEALPDE